MILKKKVQTIVELEETKQALIKNGAPVELYRKKVDWLRIIAPIATKLNENGLAVNDPFSNNSYLKEILNALKLNLKKKTETRYRDPKRHIAIHIYKKYIAIEFEGQHFRTPKNFIYALRFFRWLNTDKHLESLLNVESASERSIVKNMWHISRLDICHDYINATPDMFIPESRNEYKFPGSKHYPIYNCASDILETIYLRSTKWTLRSYRKDVEILTHNRKDKKKITGFEDEKFKDKAIARFEAELADSEILQHANDIFNLNVEITEAEFVESVMSDFLSTKYIRKINPTDSNQDRWEKFMGFEAMKDSTFVLENLPRSHSLKLPTDRNFLKRFLKSFLNRAQTEGVSPERILKMVEDEVNKIVNVNSEDNETVDFSSEEIQRSRSEVISKGIQVNKVSTVVDIHEQLLKNAKEAKRERKLRNKRLAKLAQKQKGAA